MTFDFTTPRDGQAQGSYKWLNMKKLKPDVPAGIVPLSVADMEFLLAEPIREGIADALKTTIIGYNTPTASYYESVAEWMKEYHGWVIETDSIIPVAGVVPIIEQGILQFSEEGDGVLILSPVYHPFRTVIEKHERRVIASSLLEDDGVYTIDFDDVRKKASDVKILLLCSPHNPVGRVWEENELQTLAAIAKEQDLLVISDEIHHDLALTKKHTVFATVDPSVKTLTATAPTKTFNLAGAQVSNVIVTDPDLRARFLEKEPETPSVLGLIAGEQAYRHGGPWLDALKARILSNEEIFRAVFRQRAPIVRFSPLEGTYLLWADLRAMAQDPDERIRFVTETNLFPVFGEVFGEEGLGFIRVNLAAPATVIEEAAHRLADAIERRACCW